MKNASWKATIYSVSCMDAIINRGLKKFASNGMDGTSENPRIHLVKVLWGHHHENLWGSDNLKKLHGALLYEGERYMFQ